MLDVPLNLKVVRAGVDSLYLSAKGKLYPNWVRRLVELKETAQSKDPVETAQAQVKLGGHLFEVKGRGTQHYAFILEDNCFRIELGKGESFRLAYVQVRAEYLAHAGMEGVLSDLLVILNTVGKVNGELLVSRADLCIDFVPPCSMESWPVRAWLTRARDIEPHYRHHKLTGWSFGKRAAMSGRLYDKLREITEQSKAYYLFDLWKPAGWVAGEEVWRLEAQYRRDVLDQLGISNPANLSDKLQGLWRYFTEDWLRLAIPNEGDHNLSRWPTHPFWCAVSAVPWGQGDQPRLKRFRKQRIPPDDKLFPPAMGYLASFMAREGMDDFGEGLGSFLTKLRGYMNVEGRRFDKDFEGLLADRIAAKGRLYNTLDNTRVDPKEVAAEANAYRRAKDGEDGIL